MTVGGANRGPSRAVTDSRPLVTIGIATRNGARRIGSALNSAARQTYTNIEIVVSDNASTDETPDVLSQISVRDERVRVMRQGQPVTMLRNHEATWRAARGEFFVWLADDDLLSDNFIEEAVRALQAQSEAVLAFGHPKWFYLSHGVEAAESFDYDFTTHGSSRWQRLWKDRHSGYEIKGLFRREALAHYGWYDHTISPDWPLLTYLMLVGEIIRVPEIVFYNGTEVPESGEDRARAQSFSSIERFPMLKLSWKCGLAARDAEAHLGRRLHPFFPAAITFGSLLWSKRRTLLPNAVEPVRARFQNRSSRRS